MAVAVAAACALSFRPIYEPDLWWHLAQGREVAAGRLVHTNVFNAIYPSYPQPYTPWLFDLVAYVAWQARRRNRNQIAQAALYPDVRAVVSRRPRAGDDRRPPSRYWCSGGSCSNPRAIPVRTLRPSPVWPRARC